MSPRSPIAACASSIPAAATWPAVGSGRGDWRNRPSSPTRFYAGALELDQHVLNLDFNRQLDWGMAYPLTLSYGAEWRGEEYTIGAGEPASYINGGVLLPNGQPAVSLVQNGTAVLLRLEEELFVKFA